MEQRLDATHLHPGPFERASAIGIVAVATGTGILLAAWGISLLWRYTPPELVFRQDKPFEFAPPPPIKIDPDIPPIKVEPAPPLPDNGMERDGKTSEGDVIRKEVTVFYTVKHGTGHVTTGWNYKDGSGTVPISQYCYYSSAPNADYSSTRIDLAFNRNPLPNVGISVVPELGRALAKCQWWQG
jgi:hypothetical protein